jgi:hypothetical protein
MARHERPTLAHRFATVNGQRGGNYPLWHPRRQRQHRTVGISLPRARPIHCAVTPPEGTASYLRMLIARAMTRAVVDKAMALCNVMSSFAQRVSGIVSVGEKAKALVMLT